MIMRALPPLFTPHSTKSPSRFAAHSAPQQTRHARQRNGQPSKNRWPHPPHTPFGTRIVGKVGIVDGAQAIFKEPKGFTVQSSAARDDFPDQSALFRSKPQVGPDRTQAVDELLRQSLLAHPFIWRKDDRPNISNASEY